MNKLLRLCEKRLQLVEQHIDDEPEQMKIVLIGRDGNVFHEIIAKFPKNWRKNWHRHGYSFNEKEK